MKKTFYSFGCSYTNFAWPTWANFVGTQFDRHVSYAKSGAGNRYIFLSVLDALQTYEIYKDDVFIIQWSSLCREDRILPNNNFKTPGNLDYQSEYPKCFVEKLFNPLQQVIELEKYIYVLKEVLNSNNITFRMTNMYEPYLGEFLGEPVLSDINLKNYEELKQNGALSKLKRIMGFNFLTSIENIIPDRNEIFYIKYGKHLDIQTDDHPTVSQHLAYAKYAYHDIFGDYGNLENDIINDIVLYYTKIFMDKKEVTRLADNDLMDKLKMPEETLNKSLIYKII